MNRAARWAQGLLVLACLASLIAGFLIEHHPHFAVEAWPGFFALFGFLAYCGIVLGAKRLRPWLHRPEDYYDGPPTEVNAAAPQAPQDDRHD